MYILECVYCRGPGVILGYVVLMLAEVEDVLLWPTAAS